jgi:hypothetical protein
VSNRHLFLKTAGDMIAEMSTDGKMYDHLEMRCPRLGGEVLFSYCKQEGGDLPCPRIIACWQPYFPVEAHLKEKLTSAQWDRFFNQTPKHKLTTLVEVIEAAKKRKGLSD